VGGAAVVEAVGGDVAWTVDCDAGTRVVGAVVALEHPAANAATMQTVRSMFTAGQRRALM
jgi:hypothetical protein